MQNIFSTVLSEVSWKRCYMLLKCPACYKKNISVNFIKVLQKRLYFHEYVYVLPLHKWTQMFDRTHIAIFCTYRFFRAFPDTGWYCILYLFFSNGCWSLNYVSHQTFRAKYEVKRISYIPELAEQFVKYFSTCRQNV